MHPILGDQLRLRLHLLGWSLAGGVVALLVRVLIGVSWLPALVFGLLLGLIAAPISLSAWYLSRDALAKTSAVRIGATAVGAAAITASLWAALGRWWWQLSRRPPSIAHDEDGRAVHVLLGLAASAISWH
jgi:hypothetical protein